MGSEKRAVTWRISLTVPWGANISMRAPSAALKAAGGGSVATRIQVARDKNTKPRSGTLGRMADLSGWDCWGIV
ncbi:MAG: hypothetical protein A4E73_01444 [Syntrophaceae bacterium PtaU1.Bin231]|nr:MAG: hypothetical protein A4E73_01444 [Syntrophaceae bacterium PtaU1.Bin231]